MSKQDRQLALAAVALYRAAEFGIVPDNRDTDEEAADDCIRVVTEYIEMFEYSGVDSPQVLADYVYHTLNLDRSKSHA